MDGDYVRQRVTQFEALRLREGEVVKRENKLRVKPRIVPRRPAPRPQMEKSRDRVMIYMNGLDPKSDEAQYRRNVLELVEKVKLTVYGLNELEIFYDSKGNLPQYKELIDNWPQLQRKQLPYISKVHQRFLATIGGSVDPHIFVSDSTKARFSIDLDDVPRTMLTTFYKGPDSVVFRDAYRKFVQGLVHDGVDLKSKAYRQLAELFNDEMRTRIKNMQLEEKLGVDQGIIEEGNLIALMQFTPLNEMPRTRLAQFSTLLVDMVKHARHKDNRPIVEELERVHRQFTQGIDDELRQHERVVHGQLVWNHMGMSILPNFDDNHFRAVGCVKHGKENYYVYIWSERIYIARVKDRHQMVSCLLVDIELIENDNDRLIPLVLYERRNPLENASNNSQFKERALYEPVRFFFEPVDQESVFDASKAIQWLTIRRQWIFELTQLLTNDRAKLKYYRRPGDDKCVQTVRDFYGLNRPQFQCQIRDITFVATRQICYQTVKSDDESTDPLEVVFYEGFNSDASEQQISCAFTDNLILDSKCAFYQSIVRKSQLPANHVKVNFNTQSSSSWTILPQQRT